MIVWHAFVTRPVVPSAVSYADVREGNDPYRACGTVSPLLTPVASRNILLLQSLPNSIPYRQANVRRRKDDTVWAQRREEVLSDCIVSPDVFHQMVDRLGEFVVPYQHALETEAGQHHMHLYLQGLLSHLPGKNAEDIATFVDVERQVIQDFIGTAPWDHRPLVTVLVGQVAERLGEPDGIIAFDPSSFPKRGTHSVGVKRQWCGHRGKVDNCQVGVFMGYVSRHDHALLDFRLSLPEEWARDEQRRQACHVPPEVRYQTRQEQCLEMLDAWGEQVPHGWVTGDDELGRHTRFRHELRERGERYVLGVPCTTTMRDLEAPLPAYRRAWTSPQGAVAIGDAVAQGLDARGVDALDGARRGERAGGDRDGQAPGADADRAQTHRTRGMVGGHPAAALGRPHVGGPAPLAMPPIRMPATATITISVRRVVSEGELEEPSLSELARVIKAGACIEASFKRGKSEVGMDEYQVRTWQGWHHHMALSLMAVWFLIGETHRGQQWTPALTLPQVRYGLSLLLLEVFCTPGVDYICRQVQRQLHAQRVGEILPSSHP